MSNRTRWVGVWVFAVLPLLGWWATGLFDLDEGYYAAVVGEMNRRGEWITPYFNGSPWFEKPILLYWLAKPCVALFGDMWGPRLPSVVSMIGLMALLAWFCRRRFSDAVAQRCVLVLGGSLLAIAIGRMMLTDMPLCLAMSAGLLLFWESLQPREGEPAGKFRALSGVCLGIAVLAKGPVAVIFFIIIGAWTYTRQPELRPAFKSGWVGFVLGCGALIATWYVPAYLVNGQTFVQKFLIEQNVGRFTGGDAAHTIGGVGGLVFYVPILLLGMFPWSFLVPKALLKRGDSGLLGSYLACWAVSVFVFFTISGAKLPHYILPMLPPLAILVAVRLNDKVLPYAMGWCAALCVIANGAFAWWYQSSGQQEAHRMARFIGANAGSDAVAMYQLTRRQDDRGTGSTNLQETSLPSLLLYLNRPAIDTDNLASLAGQPGPVWIFTREGRIDADTARTVAAYGRTLQEIEGPDLNPDHFRIYRLSPRPR